MDSDSYKCRYVNNGVGSKDEKCLFVNKGRGEVNTPGEIKNEKRKKSSHLFTYKERRT